MAWMDLLQLALPSGFIGGVVGWFTGRVRRKTESIDRLMELINKQSDEISELYEFKGYVLRVLCCRNNCRYIAICPIDRELRRTKANAQRDQPRNRQSPDPGTFGDNPDNYTPDTGRPPPEN